VLPIVSVPARVRWFSALLAVDLDVDRLLHAYVCTGMCFSNLACALMAAGPERRCMVLCWCMEVGKYSACLRNKPQRRLQLYRCVAEADCLFCGLGKTSRTAHESRVQRSATAAMQRHFGESEFASVKVSSSSLFEMKAIF
jgi:hypothetical protein